MKENDLYTICKDCQKEIDLRDIVYYKTKHHKIIRHECQNCKEMMETEILIRGKECVNQR